MTSTISEKRSDWKVELPQPLDQLDREIEREGDRLTRLQELGDEINPVYREAEKLDREGREIIAGEIPKVGHDLGGARTISELEEITGRIVDIVADPYRQAVRQARDAVCETLMLDSAFDHATVEELDGLLENRSSDQLRTDRVVLDSAGERLDQLTEEARDAVANHVHDAPSLVLGSPGENLQPLVNRYAKQHDALVKVDEALDGVSWSPGVTLAKTESLYPEDGTMVDVEIVTEYVGNIKGVVDTLDDELPLGAVIRSRLKTVLSGAEPATLIQTFEAISQRVTDCADYRMGFELAIHLVDGVENRADHQIGEVKHHLDMIRIPADDELLDRDDPVDGLAEHLEELGNRYDRWAKQYTQTLHRDVVAIKAIQSHIEGAPEAESSEDALALIDDRPDVDTVYENPIEAVLAHSAYMKWVEALRAERTGDDSQRGQADVDLLINLVRGRQVPSGKVDMGDYEMLAGLLEDGLILQYDGAHVPEEQ